MAKAVRPFAEKMITLGKPVEMDGGFVALKRAEVENGWGVRSDHGPEHDWGGSGEMFSPSSTPMNPDGRYDLHMSGKLAQLSAFGRPHGAV